MSIKLACIHYTASAASSPTIVLHEGSILAQVSNFSLVTVRSVASHTVRITGPEVVVEVMKGMERGREKEIRGAGEMEEVV